LYIPFDPEATENQWMINTAFVGQAQGDIRCRNWREFTGMNTNQLLEVATKVFVN
jgi:hypothetical protein